MSSFPGSPKLIKGGLVILDAGSSAVKRTIALQYNPDTLSRSYQVQSVSVPSQKANHRVDQARRGDRRHRFAQASGPEREFRRLWHRAATGGAGEFLTLQGVD